LGLSLDALGKNAGGLTRATVSGIEKGRQQVGVYQLYLFANALGVNTDDLIREALSHHEDVSKRLEEITIKTKNKSKSIRLADL
jgi:transcriptional regulator with XRE-family HTH domain